MTLLIKWAATLIRLDIMTTTINFYDGPSEFAHPSGWANCPEGTQGAYFWSRLPKFIADDARKINGLRCTMNRDENGRLLSWGGHEYVAMAGSHEPFDESVLIRSDRGRAITTGIYE